MAGLRGLALIFLVGLCAVVTLGKRQDTTTCEFQMSEWTECKDGLQNRTSTCICNGVETDPQTCLDRNIEEPEVVQTCEERICKWKWTRWTRCSASCDGGNTTRNQVCICNDEDEPTDNFECDASVFYGDEVAECNTYSCDDVPAFNKIYWIMQADEGHWPMPDDIFNCSLGYDVDVPSPRGKHYSTILRDDNVQRRAHPEWYYLAKEWIAAQLNLANGVPFPDTVIALIEQAGQLLEKCDGFVGKDLYIVYSTKEKLGRVNNNIGGLDHVDDQVSLLIGGDNGEGEGDLSKRSTLIMVLVVPGIAIFIVLAIAGVTVFYVRRKSTTVVENAAFESEDEDEEKKGKDVPLEQSNVAPEVAGEKFEDE